ncbi:MAG TPA: tetrahydrofolate dehydrogenase/cyclohydrolase catalytic domain-containing protein [Soehngenia sp.]|nr:tetrahydrofolate dehydrogenase/cyclohydrolase catalytic domain-containing protein [Soehngenia sp.]HPP31937.1 tetrahydrofolate dehydrogenase/cyclohydrolase catalytic domain-containing protein [Soehngenia sp.]
MGLIIDGKLIANNIKKDLIKRVQYLRENNNIPTLAIVRLGDNAGDISYEKSIVKLCSDVNIDTRKFTFDNDISTGELQQILYELNEDITISGILLFRPLPKHIDENIIRNSINVNKDVDCMHPLNLEKIFEGDYSGFTPCTSKAALLAIQNSGIELDGKTVAVINRSMVVGKPLAMMLLSNNATVTICHSKTNDLKRITKNSDIVVTALGKAKYLNKDYFTDNSIVIDVGVSQDENGKLSGDVDFDDVVNNVKMITPVPGGVGSITTCVLLENVVKACMREAALS